MHHVLLKNDFSHSISYSTINTLIPMKCRELLERILREKPREKQDWFIHNLIHLILQIPLLSPSPLSYLWEDYKPNPYLTKFRIVRRFLVFGKQLLIPYFVRPQFACWTPENLKISFSFYGAMRTSRTTWRNVFRHHSTRGAFLR